jgi:predicted CXXCH cytochrome family protein
MKPLWVFLGVVALVLLVRGFAVPREFGAHERGYMYGWHNKVNEDWWKNFSVKYRGKNSCKDCHEEEYTKHAASPHAAIECENCHGPSQDHPDNPEKLTVDKSRELCVRCHALLSYPNSDRGKIKGLPDPASHEPGDPCSSCHNPHHPNLEDM